MGLSRLNVFVSELDDPCGISSDTWYVTIYDCDGGVFTWCGRRYAVMPAKCGHLHVEIPPGCYYIKAVRSYWIFKPGHIIRANHFTDAAIVTVCCDQTVCVKLFNPRVHRCGYIFLRALGDLVRQKALKVDLFRPVELAVTKALKAIEGEPKKMFELGHPEDFEKLEKGGGRRPRERD